MGGNYRIKFNPSTMEIEIEGSQQFVETYFDKIQNLILSVAEEVRQEPPRRAARAPKRAAKAGRGQKTGKTARQKKAQKPATRGERPLGRRPRGSSNTDKVLTLLGENPEGITTADLKTKTGLSEQQIWGVIYAAEKRGKVVKVKRGVYTAGPASAGADAME
jgi:hypothetical protein